MTSCVAQSASTHQRRWERLREADLDYLDVDSALADDPEDDPIDATFSYDEENVCALKNPLSYCICDDKTLQTAVTIRCQIHDVASQSDDFWKAFQTQSQLQELEIRTILDGRLNFVPTVALQNLPQLRLLEIAGATISTLTMDTFSGSVLMHKLDLTRNQVGYIDAGAFHGLSSLNELVLSHNEITSLERLMFDGLDQLQSLWLDDNSINLMEDKVFEQLEQLEQLDLSANELSVLTPENLLGLNSLQQLILRNNSMAMIGANTFVYVAQLRKLDLSDNVIEKLSQKAFAGLDRLQRLDLMNNRIVSFDVDVFAELPALNLLDLKGNRLTSLGQSTFAPLWSNWMNVTAALYLNDNPIICSCQLKWLSYLSEQTKSPKTQNSVNQLTCSSTSTDERSNVIQHVASHCSDQLKSTTTSTTSTTTAAPSTETRKLLESDTLSYSKDSAAAVDVQVIDAESSALERRPPHRWLCAVSALLLVLVSSVSHC